MSNSVIQRYTPPTCTLEIKGKSSPLSRWVGQTVVKDLQFDLRFDDPRKSDESRISVKGDRAGLEKLCDAVTTYVQDFLSSKGTDLPLSIWGGQSAAEDDNGGNLLSLAPPFVKTAESVTSSDSEGDNYLNHQPETSNLRQFPGKIYLEPKGLVSHNLYLGHLANSESGPVVELSVLQLFDLATALDEYAAQMVALPNLKRTRQEQKPPAWSWVAASMVLGVGIATGTIEWRSQDRQVQQATGPKAEQSTPAPAPTPTIAQAPIPSPPSPLPTPITPTPLALAPKILPPTPVQPPAIPNSSPSPSTQNQGSKRQDLIISNPGAASQTTPTRQTPNPGQPVPPRQVPTLGQPTPPRQVPTLGQPTPPRQVPTLGQPTPPRQVPTLGQPNESRGNNNPSPQPPNQPPSLPSKLPTLKRSPTVNSDIAPPPIPAPATLTSPESATTTQPPRGRLFDRIPQVAEVRSYLQPRWKPPAELTKSLEYRIIIGLDGSIERIIPFGEAANTYIEKTNIPAVGQRFVSPPEGSNPLQIRLLLNPDGSVETFNETTQPEKGN